jgi:transcriptional regulator with GAF, ATPase, and Fis domain
MDSPREPEPRALLARGRAALGCGNVEAAKADFEAAYQLGLARKDRALEAEALTELARTLQLRGAHDQATLACESALAAARASASPALEAAALLLAAQVRERLGDAERARDAAARAARAFDDAFSAARAASEHEDAVEHAERGRQARAILLQLEDGRAGVAAKLRHRDAAKHEDDRRRHDRALLERLFLLARRLVAERDPDRVVAAVLESAIEASGAERGFLLLSPEEGDEAGLMRGAPPPATSGSPGEDHRELPEGLRVVAARNFDRAEVRKPEFKVSSTVIDRALASGKPVLVRDASADGGLAEQSSVLGSKLRSIVCLPVRSPRPQGVRGLLYLDNRFGEAAFSENDLPAFSAFAAHAALTVENARLYARAAREQKSAERARERAESLAKQLEVKLARSGEELAQVQTRLAETTSQLALRSGFGEIVGRSSAMQAVYKLLDKLKESDAPALIRGESGTGKELVARAIHYEGHRSKGPFVSESCAAIPETLLESALFGHEAGSFTNALARKAGMFELANQGTLFLDEVGELTLACQAKLLRVLQEKVVRRVGGDEEVPVDVRVIAATHRDLEAMVRDGGFREDLYFRLNVLALRMPPLRERRDDIPALVNRFFDAHAPGGKRPEVAPEVLRALINYSWPGNVRELENEVKRALALGGSGRIVLEDLSPAVLRGAGGEAPLAATPQAPCTLEEAERRALLAALKAANGSKVRAADILGIPRTSLYHRLKLHGIDVEDALRA